ncbi:MAG: 50S ribosomal protein L24 [Candidatus Aenigmarchaeota archaeon]|nr:50S ribosomal protein L24 [Candidatus Aenigmarchaeota archaeon]
MKNEWSSKWKASSQPRKQRKYRLNAPLHIRRRFMAANVDPSLRQRFGKRSMVVRKGDEVMVTRGKLRGTKGVVERVDLKGERVFIEGVKMKKVDGSDVSRPLAPSNLVILKLNVDDKRRQAVLERSGRQAGSKSGKKEVKEEGKKEGG